MTRQVMFLPGFRKNQQCRALLAIGARRHLAHSVDLLQQKWGTTSTGIPKDPPFPSERHAQNWRKVGTIETVSPEVKKQIDQKRFCIYVFTPTLSFDEIEGDNPHI